VAIHRKDGGILLRKDVLKMQDDNTLMRFKRFKTLFVSSNIPNSLLLDMVESFITLNDDASTNEAIPVLEGQISLFDYDMQFQY